MDSVDNDQAEIDAIRQEATTLGYSLTGDTLEELREEIGKVRLERAGKPPCYRREYRNNAPHCCVCDLRHKCSSGDVPAYVPVEDLNIETCDKCGGSLVVELVDEVTGDVRDYGCDNLGCPGTILQQSRTAPDESLAESVIEFVRQNVPSNKKLITGAGLAGAKRTGRVLQSLLKEKRIVYKNKRYEVSE